ncbi:MAG TPA: hypothetical protein VES20_17000 [Bryobacteraceae bacterium]|nr:hypothetical protein [Bryobacteraceae bacterium]
MKWALHGIVVLLAAARLSGQPQLRSDEIEIAREEKARHLSADTPSRFEQRVVAVRTNHWIAPILAKRDGLHVRIGGMVPGAGLAVGPEYQHSGLVGGSLILRASAQASVRRYYRGTIEASLPHLFDDRAFAKVLVMHRNYSQMLLRSRRTSIENGAQQLWT